MSPATRAQREALGNPRGLWASQLTQMRHPSPESLLARHPHSRAPLPRRWLTGKAPLPRRLWCSDPTTFQVPGAWQRPLWLLGSGHHAARSPGPMSARTSGQGSPRTPQGAQASSPVAHRPQTQRGSLTSPPVLQPQSQRPPGPRLPAPWVRGLDTKPHLQRRSGSPQPGRRRSPRSPTAARGSAGGPRCGRRWAGSAPARPLRGHRGRSERSQGPGGQPTAAAGALTPAQSLTPDLCHVHPLDTSPRVPRHPDKAREVLWAPQTWLWPAL